MYTLLPLRTEVRFLNPNCVCACMCMYVWACVSARSNDKAMESVFCQNIVLSEILENV